jgi:hypothetical protein
MLCMRRIIVLVSVLLGAAGLFAVPWPVAAVPQGGGQNPQTPPAAAAPANPAPIQKKHTYFDDFLLRGTVFTPQGASFPGAELRIRRTGEKRFRWETVTNARGEFAVRVPPGADYELIVRAKGCTQQSLAVDAKNGAEMDKLVFHMEPLQKAPKGDKK